ncbi:MAG TPA: SAM-dependent chlorinase/fluorinase [Thermoanaerobaculia bacterium]|nr:SAM-dependent chlorinase/fluorinase [Thermoanaerobaculia bacterium]
MPLITLTTDFGTRDFFVAALKGVLLSHCRGATLVDLSHDIPPGAVAEASFLLEAAAETFPAGTVHLAVVDPGVGSARELLGVRLEDAIFLAPDNGLLTPFLVPRAEIRGVDSPDLYRAASGSTGGCVRWVRRRATAPVLPPGRLPSLSCP